MKKVKLYKGKTWLCSNLIIIEMMMMLKIMMMMMTMMMMMMMRITKICQKIAKEQPVTSNPLHVIC